jgi:acetyl-CoA C-acetyltransferase
VHGYSRTDVDAYAVESQKRAATAWSEGRFARSVVPVRDDNDIVVLDRDEYLRPQTTMQTLGALEPSFAVQGEKFGFDTIALQRYAQVERIDHVHHAGNSSGIVDGAAAVLIGGSEASAMLERKPRATARSCSPIPVPVGNLIRLASEAESRNVSIL